MNTEIDRLQRASYNWGLWCRRFGYALLFLAGMWAARTTHVIVQVVRGDNCLAAYSPLDVSLLLTTCVVVMAGAYATLMGTRANRLYRSAASAWLEAQMRASASTLEGREELMQCVLFTAQAFAKKFGVEKAWRSMVGHAKDDTVTSPLAPIWREVIAADALLDFVGRARKEATT